MAEQIEKEMENEERTELWNQLDEIADILLRGKQNGKE